VRQDYLRLYGRDIKVEDFDLGLWRDLVGSYFTRFLHELREWHPRSPREETDLLAHPVVSGLEFSTFRHDNPGVVARGDFRA